MDMIWMTLGLFFLACGAVPAMLALRADRQQATTPRIAHEAARGLSLAQCERSAGLLRQLRRS